VTDAACWAAAAAAAGVNLEPSLLLQGAMTCFANYLATHTFMQQAIVAGCTLKIDALTVRLSLGMQRTVGAELLALELSWNC
jgi:hypothetical protein